MKLAMIALLAGLLSAGLAGCQNNAPSGSANSPSQSSAQSQADAQIRAAIQQHLEQASNLNLQAFDTDVKQVTVQGGHAQAQVDFHVKGGPAVMQMIYQLENRAGTWTVTESNPAGGDSPHPPVDQSQAPSLAPTPGGNPDSLADTLRSFKEGGAGAAPLLPPGHPPVNNNSGSASR
jgi:hypothetical protein